MMDNFKNEVNKIRMTPAEKAAMRARIFGAPVIHTSTASPYFVFDFQFMTRAFAGVLVVVLLGGTGIAYAAQGSLPGEPLYAVKVNVTEPIQTALATSPAARAEVHVALAQRRVEEAETLAAAGTLDATTTQELEQNFDSHADSADDLATEVGATDPSAAIEIKAELASALGVHGALLATLGDQSASSSTRSNSEHLATRVLARADTNNEDRGSASATASARVVATAVPTATSAKVRTFAAIAPSTTPTSTPQTSSALGTTEVGSSTAAQSASGSGKINTALESRAESALKKAQSTYSDAKSKMDATTTAALDAQFSQVQSDIDNGDYATALQLALKLQVVIKAQSNYRTNIITPLLQIKLNVLNQNRHQDGGDSEGHGSDN